MQQKGVIQSKKVEKGEWRMPRLLEGGEEGRGKLRKTAGICKRDLIRRCPNGATRLAGGQSHRKMSQPSELKHLSRRRKRKKHRFPE